MAGTQPPRAHPAGLESHPGRAGGAGLHLPGRKSRGTGAQGRTHRAGSRLSGSERDMAAKRGVGGRDRDALIEALTAVLERDRAAAAAVRGELAARRERAAKVLAFELAARLQAEIHAVDWITSPQRVTRAEPSDFEVFGWAGGVLVRFQVRAGRLCTWTQRACTQVNAVRHLATTPAPWADFAQRNAELAARLAR